MYAVTRLGVCPAVPDLVRVTRPVVALDTDTCAALADEPIVVACTVPGTNVAHLTCTELAEGVRLPLALLNKHQRISVGTCSYLRSPLTLMAALYALRS